jgi:hypothetical protein
MWHASHEVPYGKASFIAWSQAFFQLNVFNYNLQTALSLRSKNATPKSSNTWLRNFHLTYTSFGSLTSPEAGLSYGNLALTEAFECYLEPVPVTPTGEDSPPTDSKHY